MAGEDKKNTTSFKVGAIALAFLVIGYQTALFVGRTAMLRIESHRDRPDTVYVSDRELVDSLLAAGGYGIAGGKRPSSAPEPAGNIRVDRSPGTGGGGVVPVGRSGNHGETALRAYESSPRRRVESFRFNPNSATAEEFQRLGFTEKQAQSIIAYREKGGRFRRKADFARSYSVADSVYDRLEPYIDIPLVDINAADSAAFDDLPGIGGYFASRMVEYREKLGGYSFPEQLLEIYNFGQERLDGLRDLIELGPSDSLNLWKAGEVELCGHPYIDKRAAHGIVLYRNNNPKDKLTIGNLVEAGVLTDELGNKLSKCRIATP